MLLYGGIAVMAFVVVMAVICCIVFSISGKRLKKKLEKEYGKPYK